MTAHIALQARALRARREAEEAYAGNPSAETHEALRAARRTYRRALTASVGAAYATKFHVTPGGAK